MTASLPTAWCSECGTQTSIGEQVACANCGSTRRTFGLNLDGTVSPIGRLKRTFALNLEGSVTPTGSLSWVHERKEILRKRPWLRWFLLAFDAVALIGGFFIGQWAGFFGGLALLIAGELWGPKTVERITRTTGNSS
jgi:hypothetical protein